MGRKPSVEAMNKAVEEALLRKATGYDYTLQETFKVKNAEFDPANGKKIREEEKIEVVEVYKHVPPEYSAIALWLKARSPSRWGEAASVPVQTIVRVIDDVPAAD